MFTADELKWSEVNWTELQFWIRVFQRECSHWKSENWNELNWSSRTRVLNMLTNRTVYSKLTQLHDALLVKRVSVTKLIGCRVVVRALQFANSSSASWLRLLWTRLKRTAFNKKFTTRTVYAGRQFQSLFYAMKTTHGLDGQHQDVGRTPRGRVNQNDRGRR